MPLDLQTLTGGDTNYIGKHNGNYSAIKSAIEALQTLLGNSVNSNAAAPQGFEAAFGTNTVLLGASSYADSTSGTDLILSAGYAWIASNKVTVHMEAPITLPFSGRTAATYYIKLDGLGTPYIDTATSSDAIYSVVWTGTAFGTITQLVGTQWSATEMAGMLTSAAYVLTYATLDARLEDSETRILNRLSRGRYQITSTGGSFTVTAADYVKRIIQVNGTLASNATIILPATDGYDWIAVNNTTGAFTVEFKTASGTGVTVAQTKRACVYADGTNIVRATADA